MNERILKSIENNDKKIKIWLFFYCLIECIDYFLFKN